MPPRATELAYTCQRPLNRTTVGSFTATRSWAGSRLGRITGPVDVQAIRDGSPGTGEGRPFGATTGAALTATAGWAPGGVRQAAGSRPSATTRSDGLAPFTPRPPPDS